MPYFLFAGIVQPGHPFQMEGEEAGHILKSRRIQTGEVIHIQDLKGLRYASRVDKIGSRKLVLMPLQEVVAPSESPLRIHLRQALVKEKALDAIIRKSTELGVSSISFIQSRYSQRLPARSETERRVQRWQRIAVEACKQSGRRHPPSISFEPDWIKFNQVSEESSIETMPLVCLESSADAVPLDTAIEGTEDVVLLVGPEGGWAPEELEGLPARKVFLGPRILRSETAAIAAVSILQFLHGDLNGLVVK